MEPDWVRNNREANERWVNKKIPTEKELRELRNQKAKQRGNMEFKQLRGMDNSYAFKFSRACRG
jgi:hypothetical protein